MPTNAESVHSVVLIGQSDPFSLELVSSPTCPPINGAEHRLFKASNALGWASVGLLFAHAVLVSIDSTLCLVGCEPTSVTATRLEPTPLSEDADVASDPIP